MNPEEKLRETLEELFPKLNTDDPTIPSPNNRSAALVLYAEALILMRKIKSETLDQVKEAIEELRVKK